MVSRDRRHADAAAQLCSSGAARLRDQIAKLAPSRRSRSTAIFDGGADVGLVAGNGEFCVALMFIRAGRESRQLRSFRVCLRAAGVGSLLAIPPGETRQGSGIRRNVGARAPLAQRSAAVHGRRCAVIRARWSDDAQIPPPGAHHAQRGAGQHQPAREQLREALPRR